MVGFETGLVVVRFRVTNEVRSVVTSTSMPARGMRGGEKEATATNNQGQRDNATPNTSPTKHKTEKPSTVQNSLSVSVPLLPKLDMQNTIFDALGHNIRIRQLNFTDEQQLRPVSTTNNSQIAQS